MTARRRSPSRVEQRQLHGGELFDAALGSVTEAHYAAAERVLRAFEWVLVLNSTSMTAIVEDGLAWRGIDLRSVEKQNWAPTAKQNWQLVQRDSIAEFSDDDRRVLEPYVAFDRRLYQLAMQLSRLDELSMRRVIETGGAHAFKRRRRGGC